MIKGCRQNGATGAILALGRRPSTPAVSGRLLLVRNDREAACYELPVAGEIAAVAELSRSGP